MNITAISDLHGHLPEIAPCDLLLIGGDICPFATSKHFREWWARLSGIARVMADIHSPNYQAHWLDTEFRDWLEGAPARRIVGVAGNHDFVFERAPNLVPALPWTYLQDSGCEVEGVKVYGSPWQPPFGDWAFNAPESERIERWKAIPDDTEVLVLHGPPFGYGDLTSDGGRAGCPFLRERVEELPRLKLAVFGHIHEGRGRWNAGDKTLANVTLRDGRYAVVHEPMTFSLAPAGRVG